MTATMFRQTNKGNCNNDWLVQCDRDGTWVDLAEGFRLHAPRQTVVEGRVRDGHFVFWTVTPERRREDVIIAGAE